MRHATLLSPAPQDRIDTPDRWQRLAAELRDPDLELDSETFVGIWQTFQRERRQGRTIDPVLASLLGLLHRQCLLTDDATDDDDGPLVRMGAGVMEIRAERQRRETRKHILRTVGGAACVA